MRRYWLALLVVAALFAAACSGDDDDAGGSEEEEATDDGGEGVAADGEGWTVLAYSIADTDLEPFLLGDVEEMAGVGSQEGLNIVALVDRAADYSADPLLGIDDWVGGKLLEIGAGEAAELVDMGDVNTGDPQVLTDFIAQGIADYPAANYALIISDHGASWPGVGGDESAEHDSLTLEEIDAAIAGGLAESGVEKLDLLGFDACLMATYEVASVLAPHADRMLASQELEPGHGWDYSALQTIADDPSIGVDALGAALIDGFEAQAAAEGTSDSITLSLTDLTQMGAVDEALGAFGAALTERGAAVAPVIGRTLATNLGFGRSPDPSQDTYMTDLGLLASQIGVEALDVSDQADALIRAINDAIIDKVEGQAMAGATGLSIYFPPADYFSPDYTAVETSASWNAFLAGYYGVGEAIPAEQQPQFTNADGIAETFFDEDGLNILGTYDPAAAANLASATISYGLVNEDGSVTFIGDEPAVIVEDQAGQAFGIYDLTVLTISDGEDTAYAYLSLTEDEATGTFTIDVPMSYYAPDEPDVAQDVLLTLIVDSESGDVLNETYYAYNSDLGTYGELTADPAGIIVPNVLTIGADGTQSWTPTTDVGLFADLPNLAYNLEPLESGTALYVELGVTDFGGNTASVSAEVVVP